MSEVSLESLEHFASLLLSDAELDVICELEEGTVAREIHKPGSLIGRAVQKGRLQTKCEINESILSTARRHSNPAQQMAAEMLKRIDSQ